MCRAVGLAAITTVLLLVVGGTALSANRVVGKVTRVENSTIIAEFPVPVRARAMMMIMTGEGESLAGVAIVQECTGDAPPYQVRGALHFAMDAVALSAGKKAYVNSANAGVAPSASPEQPPSTLPARLPDQDLKLYYFAAGQTVGYGALGLGYERTIRLARGVGIELDGGITGIGNIGGEDSSSFDTDQLIKSANGKLRLDLAPAVGVYSSYRWNRGQGDDDHWDQLSNRLQGKDFIAPSGYGAGTVLARGIEYGVSLRPFRRAALSLGYIPEYRTDYGSIGVRSEPAYTAEMRLNVWGGTARLRGLRSDNYWLADLGVTIR